jgi:SAM-dependent methyltransferase
MADPSAPVPPTDPRFYGEAYYARDLHARHWFRNNAAKFQARWDNVLRLLEPQAGDVVLELGCAAGEHTLQLAPHVQRAIGLDFSPAAIRLARDAALRAGSAAEFVEGDVRALTAFADGSVDKVLAMDLVEHIEDDTLQAMLAECARVLRPGGRLVLYTPSATHYVERLKARNLLLRQLPGHIAVRGSAAYGALLSGPGWARVEISHLPSTYPLFGRADRLLMGLPAIGPLFRHRILVRAFKA